MAKQAARRPAASSVKNVRRVAKRATARMRPAMDDFQDDVGSALTAVQREGRDVYRAVEKRFGRTPTLSMLTVAGAGLAIGALLLGMASARQSQAQSSNGRARQKA